MPPSSPRQARNLLDHARKGYPLRVCARLARVRPRELAAWVEDGDRDEAEGETLLFTQQWHENQCLFIAEQHDAIANSRQAASKEEPNCGARLALLERLHPDLYGRREPEGPEVDKSSNVPARVAELDPEDRAALKAALERRKGSRQVADVGATNLKRL